MAAGGNSNDLNLIPYLDIVVTLTVAIFAMVMTVKDLGQLSVPAPSYGPGTGKGVSVEIRPEGYALRVADEAVILPRRDAWPDADLTKALRGLRDAGEDSGTLTLSATAGIPYSVVIGAMDAARSDTAGLLYPSVSLAVTPR
jgi:biopolymer transport protein ExbD